MSYGWRLGAPLLVCCLWLSAPSIAQASTKLFSYTGSEQTVTVPAGVTSIHVVAVGAPGGSSGSGSGGLGAQASTDLSVTPGETLYIEVGGNGSDASFANGGSGGFNGGGNGISSPALMGAGGAGGGGGASDIRTSSRTTGSSSLSSRLIVAAGGGGGGGAGGATGGQGGAAGHNGAPLSTSGCPTDNFGCGGAAASASSGGSGGAGQDVCMPTGEVGKGADGAAGTGGAGAGDPNGSCTGGGGGGGGVYGGGGGGAADNAGGGGGGGSSGFGSGAANKSVAAATTTTPSITLTYRFALKVTKGGTGKGQVTSSPTGISCGTTCTHDFPSGSVVKLAAKPSSGSRFTGWSGACTGTATCSVTMNAAKSVTATFTVIPPPNTTITRHVISSANRTATFYFKGSGGVGALHFQCKLDSRAWTACSSPISYTRATGLKKGSHTFQVRVIDSRGKVDPTPAKLTFSI